MGNQKLNYGPDNCNMSFDEDGTLVIRLDPNADLGDSATAKSRIVAKTQGNRPLAVPGTNRQISVGLKVFATKPKSERPKTSKT